MPLKPVCVPCQRFFRPKKNSFYFIEGSPICSEALPGTAEPEKWKPYKVWAADLWRCEGCGAEVLSGFGRNPISIQHEPDFANWIKTLHADQLIVKDC